MKGSPIGGFDGQVRKAWWVPLIAAAIGAISQHRANRRNEEAQERFARSGLQWRVADARAAGLHPVFGLGGNVSSFSPSAQPVMSGADAARATQSIGEADLRAAQLRVLEAGAEKDFALAAAARSEAARNDQALMSMKQPYNPVAESFPVADPRGQHLYDLSVNGGRSYEPVFSGGPQEGPLPPSVPNYLTAKVLPGLTRFNFAGIGEVLLPSQEAAESMESIESSKLLAAIIAANVAHYGPAGKERALKAWRRLRQSD